MCWVFQKLEFSKHADKNKRELNLIFFVNLMFENGKYQNINACLLVLCGFGRFLCVIFRRGKYSKTAVFRMSVPVDFVSKVVFANEASLRVHEFVHVGGQFQGRELNSGKSTFLSSRILCLKKKALCFRATKGLLTPSVIQKTMKMMWLRFRSQQRKTSAELLLLLLLLLRNASSQKPRSLARHRSSKIIYLFLLAGPWTNSRVRSDIPRRSSMLTKWLFTKPRQRNSWQTRCTRMPHFVVFLVILSCLLLVWAKWATAAPRLWGLVITKANMWLLSWSDFSWYATRSICSALHAQLLHCVKFACCVCRATFARKHKL